MGPTDLFEGANSGCKFELEDRLGLEIAAPDLPYIWSDPVFFVSFLVLTSYCAAPLAVWWVRLHKQMAGDPAGR